MDDLPITAEKPNRHSRRKAAAKAAHSPETAAMETPAIVAATVPDLPPAAPVEPEPEMPADPGAPDPESAAPITPTPVAAMAPVITEEVHVMQEEMNTLAAEATDTAETMKDGAETLFAKVQDGAKDAVAKSQAFVAEAADFGKGNVEAMMESSRISVRGFESLAQDNAAYTKASFENATATMKTAASVQSPVELMKLQGDYMRSAFDAWMAQASKNTEAMLKLANDASQPLSSRVALAAEKVKLAA